LSQVFNLNIHPHFRIKEKFRGKEETDYPAVLLAITIDRNAIFVPEFFEKIRNLDYPESRLDIYISCQSEAQRDFVDKLVRKWIEEKMYRSIILEIEFEGK
jgi:hypothetical protein